MESFLAYFTLFSILLFASTTDARKDPSEYWKGVMQDQQMPEALKLQGLVVRAHPVSTNINKGQLVKNCESKDDLRLYAEDFGPYPPNPNVQAIYDIKSTAEEDEFSAKYFGPIITKPNVQAYIYDIKSTAEEDESFAKNLGPIVPKPNMF